jgi:hypothetical protein
MIPNNNLFQLNIEAKFTKMTVAKELSEEEIKELKKLKHKLACKKYYQKNKEKVIKHQLEFNKEYVKQSINCECGDTYTVASKYYHMRSKRHSRRIENIKIGVDAGARDCDRLIRCDICNVDYQFRYRRQHVTQVKHLKKIEDSINNKII